MLPCSPGSGIDVFPENPMSLQICGRQEAERFKWILSEQQGRDLGDQAIRIWISDHWNGFLRHRWLEHLEGKTHWLELREEDFGLLRHAFRDSPLILPILDRLKALQENWNILWWAVDVYNKAEIDEIIEILTALDVNRCRLLADFAPRSGAGNGGSTAS